MPSLLLTGFEPFEQAPANPAQQLAELLSREGIAGLTITAATLPVAAGAAPAQIEQLLWDHRPDWCVMLGLAAGRPAISIERVAINLCDFRVPDNAGEVRTDTPIVPGGPDAYFSTLPARALLGACERAGAPAELSLSAGAYLCNMVFYVAQHVIAQDGLPTRAGFIHLPATPELAVAMGRPTPSMSLATMAAGLRAALALLAEH